MPQPLNILIAEDSEDDAELVMGAVRGAGFDPRWNRVETEADFLSGLASDPEIIFSDYSMPRFDGLRAAQLARERAPDIPFILISGTLGEDAAVEAMKTGVTDYFLKDRLARLGKAVEQALSQRAIRVRQRQAETALSLFRSLVDRSSDGVDVVDPETGRFLDVNQTTCERLGYTREELLGMCVPDIEVAAFDRQSWGQVAQEIKRLGAKVIEGTHRRRDGATFPIEANVRHLTLDREYFIASVRDVTERRRAETRIQDQLTELSRWRDATLGREMRILELKKEVNQLLAQQNQPERYANPAAE